MTRVPAGAVKAGKKHGRNRRKVIVTQAITCRTVLRIAHDHFIDIQPSLGQYLASFDPTQNDFRSIFVVPILSFPHVLQHSARRVDCLDSQSNRPVSLLPHGSDLIGEFKRLAVFFQQGPVLSRSLNPLDLAIKTVSQITQSPAVLYVQDLALNQPEAPSIVFVIVFVPVMILFVKSFEPLLVTQTCQKSLAKELFEFFDRGFGGLVVSSSIL